VITTSFRRLEVFVTAVESGSFQACAERLNITQASVSNHITALEAQIGHKLYIRQRGRPGVLTESGARTYERAKDLIERAEQLCDGAHLTTNDRAARQITIGLHGFVALQFSRVLAEFVSEHPKINIVLETANYEEVVEGVRNDTLDIAYFFATGEVPEIKSEHVWTEPVKLYAGLAHPLTSKSSVTASDLMDYELIAPPRPVHLRKLIHRLLEAIGVSTVSTLFETEDQTSIVNALCLGSGYACLFERGLPETDATRLSPLAISIPNLQVRASIPPKYRHDPIIQALTKRLASQASLDLREWSAKRGVAL